MRKLLIITTIFLLIGCGSIKRQWDEYAREMESSYQSIGIPKHRRDFKYKGTTPLGAPYESTQPVPREALDAYDRGVSKQIAIIRQYQQLPADDNRTLSAWNAAMNVSDYPVHFIDPTGINQETEPGSPHINVREYMSAGTVLGMNEALEELKDRPIMVLPQQAGQGWRFLEYLENTAWNEAEHLAEFQNRRNAPQNLWMRYVYDPNSEVHPHRPALDAPVGFKSQTMPRCHIATN